MNAATAVAYARPPRSPNWVVKNIVAPVLVSAVIAIASYAVGLGTNEAVHAAAIARVENDVAALQRDKVSKDQFVEFQHSVDDLKNETRLLRQELGATRAALERRR